MGVDYYSCHECGDTFPDCGNYYPCDCGFSYCCEECADKETTEPENDDDEGINTCKYCRNEAVTTDDILNFLCKKYQITITEARRQCLEDAKNGK